MGNCKGLEYMLLKTSIWVIPGVLSSSWLVTRELLLAALGCLYCRCSPMNLGLILSISCALRDPPWALRQEETLNHSNKNHSTNLSETAQQVRCLPCSKMAQVRRSASHRIPQVLPGVSSEYRTQLYLATSRTCTVFWVKSWCAPEGSPMHKLGDVPDLTKTQHTYPCGHYLVRRRNRDGCDQVWILPLYMGLETIPLNLWDS